MWRWCGGRPSIWVRRHYQHPLDLTKPERRLRRLVRAVMALDLLFMLGWFVLLASSGGNPLLNASMDPKLRLIQLVGWLGTLDTLVVLYGVVRLWRANGEWWVSHLGNLAMATAAVASSWFLLHWHLLHFSINY